jgi:hypothetical protein
MDKLRELTPDVEMICDEESGMERIGDAARTASGRPEPDWVRGRCPECGDDLVSNLYYIGGQGYLIVWECWASLRETGACEYRRVL